MATSDADDKKGREKLAFRFPGHANTYNIDYRVSKINEP